MNFTDLDYAFDDVSAEDLNTIVAHIESSDIEGLKDCIMTKLDGKLLADLSDDHYHVEDFVGKLCDYVCELNAGLSRKKFRSALIRNLSHTFSNNVNTDEVSYPVSENSK